MRITILALLGLAAAAQGASQLFFIENRGQAEPSLRYLVMAQDLTAGFTSRAVLLQLRSRTIRIEYPNASAMVRVEGSGNAGVTNFLNGNDAERWNTGAPAYASVVYRNLYPGIDMRYGGSGRRLKSEFVVRPGADPDWIRIRYTGADSVNVARDGSLIMRAGEEEVREAAPEIYQENGGSRQPITGSYRILADGTVGLEIGPYDRTRTLVIDPTLDSSTYLGGSGADAATAVAADASGNVYVAGWTDSPGKTTGGGVDAFVAKWSADGSLVYCTYFGGSGDDRAFGVAIDGSGNAYVAGWTGSANFPTKMPLQGTLAGGRDAFVAKFNPSGALVYSTYLGGNGYDSANGIALSPAGDIYIAGETSSSNFPVVSAFQTSTRGAYDGFAARISAAGNQLVYSTYLGGSADDRARAIAVDGSGNAYLTGATSSTDFPVANAFQAANHGREDAFVTKLSPDGRSLLYSTYLGGTGGTIAYVETGSAIAVDAAGSAYVAGTTGSTDFPVTAGLQPYQAGGGIDSFVTKLNPGGYALVYSTYLGGSSLDYAFGIALDQTGSAYVTGYTASDDFPVAGALQAANAGTYDAFLAHLSADGNTLVESTYLGGTAIDSGNAVAVIGPGDAVIVGQTLSTQFPLKSPTQGAHAGGIDAFVAHVSPAAAALQGGLDHAACDAINGWATDASHPYRRPQLGIYDGETLLTTFVPGAANGVPRFFLTPPARLLDGKTHTVHVRFMESGAELSGSPAAVTCGSAFQGYHDASGCRLIAGWAWDRSHPETPVRVDILDGSTVLGSAIANQYRPDLVPYGIGTGYYGFQYPIRIADGNRHTIRVRFSGTNTDLANTYQTINCVKYEGFLDGVSCSRIFGWAWNAAAPEMPVTVSLMDGGRLLKTLQANEYRPDIARAGVGGGYYGFSYVPGPELRDGKPHSIRAILREGGLELINSSRVLTCGP